MQPPLPQTIVTQLEALGCALMTCVAQQHGQPLAAQEAAVLTVVRAALPGLLGAVMGLSTPDLAAGIATVQRRCPGCDQLVRMHSLRPRQLQTTCGRVGWRRPYYVCPTCHQGFSPADQTLEIPPSAQLSPALVTWLVELGTATTPKEVIDLLARLTGLTVAADTVRVHTTQAGDALVAADAAAIAQVQQTREAAEAVDPVPGQLVVEADGVMIRYQDGWHEVKVGVVGGTVDGALTAQSYVAARESAETFGPRLLTEAARRGALDVVDWTGPLGGRSLAVLRPVHVVADGAPWIWNLAADHFGARTELIDFYHAAQHLWAVAHALFGDGTPQAAAWAHARLTDLRTVGGAPVRAALAVARAPTAAATAVLRRERGYFATNAARMDYPAIAAEGLPIGSGAVESSAKHVIQHRMKRPGQRWSAHGAAAMIALRARAASGRPLTACA